MAQSTIKVPNYVKGGLISESTIAGGNINNSRLNSATLRFGLKDNINVINKDTPRVELRTTGASPTLGLAFVYYNESGNSVFCTLFDSDGNYMPEYVQSGTLSILSSRVTHSETVLQKCGKLVVLSDKFTPSSNINAYTTFLQAPGGYKPKQTINFMCAGPGGSTACRLYINTDGTIGSRDTLTSGTEYCMYVSYFIP